MVPPHFCLQKEKGGFQREISDQCLTKEQTKQLYDKIEIGEMVNIRKLDGRNVPIPPRQATITNDVNQYEKALLSGRNMKKGSNSQIEHGRY